MTAYTSAATGNWSSSGSWSPSGVPGTGDTVVISGHTITLDQNTIIGTSGGAGVAAVTVQSSGSLTIGDYNVTFNGDLVNNNCAINVSAGASITFGSGSGDTTYGYVGSTGHNQSSQIINFNGSSGNRITWTGGWLNDGTGPWLQGCQVGGAGYVDFVGVGDASTYSIRTSPTGSASFVLLNATFTTCGRIGGTYNMGATCTYRLENVTMSGTVHATDSLKLENASSYTSGTRTISGCVFDKQVHIYTGLGMTVTDNYFADVMDSTAGATDWVSASGNFFESQNNTPPGGLSDSYFCEPDATDNPHFMQPNAAANATYSGLIFEAPAALNTSDAGDCILLPSPGSTRTYTIENCIVLPTNNGRTSGCLFSALGNTNVRISCNHNTWWLTADDPTVNKPALGTLEESLTMSAGQVTSFKSNIAASSSSRAAYLIRNVGSNTSNIVAGADADYNAVYNMEAGAEGGGYDINCSVTPGANDISADPSFVDPTRDIAAWDASLGGPGTVANAIAELKKKNTATYNSDYNISDLITFVREGFAPTEPSYENAGHDGVTIGAVEFAGGPVVISLPSPVDLDLAFIAPSTEVDTVRKTVLADQGEVSMEFYAPTTQTEGAIAFGQELSCLGVG